MWFRVFQFCEKIFKVLTANFKILFVLNCLCRGRSELVKKNALNIQTFGTKMQIQQGCSKQIAESPWKTCLLIDMNEPFNNNKNL